MKVFVLLAILFHVSMTNAYSKTEPQNIMVHIKRFGDDLHSPFMAMKLANNLRKKGHNITVFLSLEGVRLADQSQPLDLHWGHAHMTLESLVDSFIKAGGIIKACPHCSKAIGLTDKRVRKGMAIATEEELATMIEAAEKILDY